MLFAQRRTLHRSVAEWYEETFEGEQLAPYYSLLVHHYHHAESVERERHYAKLAGEQAAAQFANAEAVRYLSRALELTPQSNLAECCELLLAREAVYDLRGEREAQAQDLAGLVSLAEEMNGDEQQAAKRRAQVAYLWGRHYEAIGEYSQAQAAVEQALVVSQGRDDVVGGVRCLTQLGSIARRRGEYDSAKAWYNRALTLLQDRDARSDEEAQALAQVLGGLGTICCQQAQYDEAWAYGEQALALYQTSGNRIGEAQALNSLGAVAYYQRDYAEALSYHRQALEIRRAIGDRAGKAISLCNLALAIQGVGDYGRAQGYLSAALVIHQATGNRWEEVTIWNNLGGLHQELGDLRQAESCLQRGLELSQEIGDEAGQTYILINLGLVACERGDLAAADRQLADGLAMAKKQDDKRLVSGFLSVMSIASLQAGKLEQSVEQSKAALALHKEMDLRSYTADDLATLAAAYLAVGDLTQALDCTQQSWIILEECGGEGPEFPQRDYFICYQVLSAAGQGERARAALQSAYDLIMARAEKITDPALRRSFLEGVQVNQVIVAAWEENSVTTGRYSGTR